MPLLCAECGAEIPEGELVCFNCGSLVPDSDIPDFPVSPIVSETPDLMPDGAAQPAEPEPETEAGGAADAAHDGHVVLPEAEVYPEAEEPMHYEGASDESMKRGCLIAVGVLAGLILILMMIITLILGTLR